MSATGNIYEYWPQQQQWVTCNCACQRCMAGGCCLTPNVPTWDQYTPPTTYITTTGTGPLVPVHEHDYRKFDPARLFCRTCGDIKSVARAADDNGEGPVDENEAKRRAKEVLARPEHRKPKGSPEDRATEDDAVEGEDE